MKKRGSEKDRRSNFLVGFLCALMIVGIICAILLTVMNL